MYNGVKLLADEFEPLGAGLDPQNLSQSGPQLLFVSDSNTDALGNGFNFDGDAIRPTDLNLPGDREVQVSNAASVSAATPLAADSESTVGIQFAGTGDTIAVIHHTGLGNAGEGTVTTEHFEIEREKLAPNFRS